MKLKEAMDKMAQNAKILVIDDEVDTREILQRMLKEKYEVILAASGEEGFRLAKKELPDIALLDLRLPKETDGIQTLDDLLSIDPKIYIIMITGETSIMMVVETIKKGAYNYITKPFKKADLLQAIERGIEWRRLYLETRGLGEELAIKLYRQSIIKRCFITGGPFCKDLCKEEPRRVFVGIPFTKEFDDVYKLAIEPVLKKYKLCPWRADEHKDVIHLMCKICGGIQSSRLGIIDITGWNPNVLFELGLLYGLAKVVIIIKNKKSELPVNLRGLEYVGYSSCIELKEKLIDHPKLRLFKTPRRM